MAGDLGAALDAHARVLRAEDEPDHQRLFLGLGAIDAGEAIALVRPEVVEVHVERTGPGAVRDAEDHVRRGASAVGAMSVPETCGSATQTLPSGPASTARARPLSSFGPRSVAE